MTEKETFNFERSFARLEAILERMNSGNVSLDDSLKLYEEADGLIGKCADKLKSAENRIEMLIQKRDGTLSLDPKGNPQTTPIDLEK